MEPIPQGVYTIGEIDFAASNNDYTASHGQGLGPVWVPITATFSDDRGAFGFHLDAGAQGTAGCVGFYNVDELRDFVSVLRTTGANKLDVNWGLK
jgi:lysozyme